MHSTVVVLLSLFCTGWSKDVTLGNAEGRKIFDEVRQASPAIWRQYENVTVIAPDNELISKVVITDMRPEKDGDAQIVNGGDGQKSVTIELKSPTVLRGYDFHIEVYSVPDTVATDAEEHLYNEAVTPTQSSEDSVDTELPDSARNNHDDEPIQGSYSTKLPDSANSKDIKDFSTLISDSDSTRPARENEEKNSQIDVPEDEISSASESNSENEKDISLSQNEEKTTELPETRIEDSIVDLVNPDNIRPARETELVTSDTDSVAPAIDSTEAELNFATTEAASETLMTEAASETLMTEATTEVSDDASTTEAVTITPYEQSTLTSISYYNSENVPNQPQPINILDYIKNREALRPMRHTEEEKHEENIGMSELSVQTDENNDYTTPLADETSSMKPDDDTVDLVPPEINANFNSDFSGSETTVIPTEVTTLNNVPRAGRGIDFDSGNENESNPTLVNTDEEFSTTTSPLNADVTTATLDEDHIIASSDDQFRNTRGASKDVVDENDVNISEEMPQENMSNEEDISSGEADGNQLNRNIIIINLEELMTRDENNKFAYALPIVLIINSENNNYPMIKIIAEDASNNRDNSKELFPTLPSETSLEPAEYEGMENDRIKGDTSSGDYDQSR